MKEKSAMSRKWKEKKDRGMRLKLVERAHFMCDKKVNEYKDWKVKEKPFSLF